MSTASPLDRIVVVGAAAVTHLAALGLSVPLLHRPLNHGVSQALEIDDDHPLGSAGTQMYEWGTWRLRKELRPDGWRPQRIRNVEWTIEPEKRWRIVLMSGDEATGDDANVMPHSRYPRGREGRRQAKQNIVQPQLVLPVRVGDADPVEPGPVSYALLHYYNPKTNEVRAELSIPAGHNRHGVVVDWYKRIILPAFEPGGGPGAVQAPQATPTPPVEVRRRDTA